METVNYINLFWRQAGQKRQLKPFNIFSLRRESTFLNALLRFIFKCVNRHPLDTCFHKNPEALEWFSPPAPVSSVLCVVPPGVYVIDSLQLSFPPRQCPLRHILPQNHPMLLCRGVSEHSCGISILKNNKNLKPNITESGVSWYFGLSLAQISHIYDWLHRLVSSDDPSETYRRQNVFTKKV